MCALGSLKMAKHTTCNHEIVGSTPTPPAKKRRILRSSPLLHGWKKHF